MRLWDRAGAETNAGGVRRLTRRTYEDIGRMADALSRHADEILAQCAGKELAVEQAFRALSELDREGRAIRRALRFDKLLAETGVRESDLRAVLDRFRAPSCSFLLPSLSASPTLAADERVDIGHEALLRRWKRIAGRTEAVNPKTGRPPVGWLADEQSDGQRYHTLVSLLDGNADGERATLDDPERTKNWWEHLPRTAAWADRYGGKFEQVKTLIDDAIEAKRRSRRNRLLAGALGVVGLLAAGAWFTILEKGRQEDIDRRAMTSAKTLLEDVRKAYKDKSLDFAGADSLATISGQFLDNVRASTKTSAADLLWGEALNDEADLKTTLSRNTEALALARLAKDDALSLTQSNPRAQEPLQLLYDAAIRVGNALSGMGKAQNDNTLKEDALKEYNTAAGIAEKIVSMSDDEKSESDVIDAHMKIGDLYKDGDVEQHRQALAEYQSGLAICEAALAKHPNNFDLLRNKGKAFYRIAELKRTEDAFDDSRAFYRKASEVQEALVARNAKEALASPQMLDPSLKSNLAASYTHWGLLEKKANAPTLALAKLQRGVALDEQLVESEPGNLQWQDYVTPNYLSIAEILEQLNRPQDALAYYQKLFDARRMLSFRVQGPGRPKAQKEFAEAARMFGDHSTGLAQIDAYRSAMRVYGRMIDDSKAADLAADQFDLVSALARGFDDKRDWPDAQTAHRVAMKIAVFNYVKNPEDTSWRDKAEAAERALVKAQVAAETAPADAPHSARPSKSDQ